MQTLIDQSNAMRRLVESAADKVVAIRNDDGTFASGLSWGDGYVVTAEEAIADAARIVTPSGRDHDAVLVGRDPSTDIAVFRIDETLAAFAPADPVEPGDIVLAIGRGATSALVASGIVSETGPEWISSLGGKVDRRIHLELGLRRRGHGGAIVDAAGHLVGLAAFGPRRRPIVIPAATMTRIVARIIGSGSVARGYLGLQLHPLRDGGRRAGAIVVSVDDKGPAAAAGLLVGDSILSWNGTDVSGARQVFRMLGPDSVGRTIALGILRGGQPSTIDVVVGSRPHT